MPFKVVEFQDTPNPNAVKCWLDHPISDRMRSFLNRTAAEADPIAHLLFEEAPITTLLFGGTWLTVNKQPEAKWPAVKKQVEAILARVPDPAPSE